MNAPAREFPSGSNGTIDWRPGRLWSLWDMIEFDFKNLIRVAMAAGGWGNAYLAILQTRVDEERGQDYRLRLADTELTKITSMIDEMIEVARPIGLLSTIAQAERLKQEIITPSMPVERDNGGIRLREQHIYSIASGLVGLSVSVHDGLENKISLMILPEKVCYYLQSDPLFGKDVFNALSSANDDIAEAGNCIALDRGTACVLHLMRVVEVGLTVLAKALGVTKQHDWGKYLGEIDKALTASIKISGARSPDEQFYAEAAITIDNMRRAWRNPTMHSDRSYSVERAEEILQSVKSFMRHLVTKLHE